MENTQRLKTSKRFLCLDILTGLQFNMNDSTQNIVANLIKNHQILNRIRDNINSI